MGAGPAISVPTATPKPAQAAAPVAAPAATPAVETRRHIPVAPASGAGGAGIAALPPRAAPVQSLVQPVLAPGAATAQPVPVPPPRTHAKPIDAASEASAKAADKSSGTVAK